MRAAALALKDGTVRIPLRCGKCRGTSLYEDTARDAGTVVAELIEAGYKSGYSPADAQRVLTCVSCGWRTSYVMAHKLRKQEIRAFIENGIDVPLIKKNQQ